MVLIVPQVAAWITMQGHIPCMCRSLVCPEMKGLLYCQAVTTCFDVVVTVERTKCHDNYDDINHDKNTFYEPLFAKQDTVMRLKPKVIDVDYDLIIGYQDLKLHPELLRDLLDKPTITGKPQWAPEEMTMRRHLLAAFRNCIHVSDLLTGGSDEGDNISEQFEHEAPWDEIPKPEGHSLEDMISLIYGHPRRYGIRK